MVDWPFSKCLAKFDSRKDERSDRSNSLPGDPTFICRYLIARACPVALTWEEVMPTLVGFNTFAELPEEQISEKITRRILSGDQGMLVWWSIGAGVHVESHSHANEQIVWMLKGKMEFRLGSEQRVCGPGDVVVIPAGTEHEGWFREDTEVIDFFAPPRDDFLRGGKPDYMSEG
jgi:quercetin dioxygenase-like cupin family protein